MSEGVVTVGVLNGAVGPTPAKDMKATLTTLRTWREGHWIVTCDIQLHAVWSSFSGQVIQTTTSQEDHYHGPEIYESLPEQVALIYLPILKSTPVERQTLVRVTILVEVDQSVF